MKKSASLKPRIIECRERLEEEGIGWAYLSVWLGAGPYQYAETARRRLLLIISQRSQRCPISVRTEGKRQSRSAAEGAGKETARRSRREETGAGASAPIPLQRSMDSIFYHAFQLRSRSMWVNALMRRVKRVNI